MVDEGVEVTVMSEDEERGREPGIGLGGETSTRGGRSSDEGRVEERCGLITTKDRWSLHGVSGKGWEGRERGREGEEGTVGEI